MNKEAPPLGECGHEGTVLIEPGEDNGRETYRASCLSCLSYGPPRLTHGAALEVLLQRAQK